MELGDVTPLILTYNEAPNIQRTLAGLTWASQIVVIDSFSTDHTLQLIDEFPNVQFYQRQFDHFADQCNFGLTKIETPWTLSLDADYKCPDALATELAAIDGGMHDGYRVGFRYCVHGRPLRATLYPPRVVLYQTRSAHYERDGHAHRVRIAGNIGELKTNLLHDDRKPLSTWLASQVCYAREEVTKLSSTQPAHLSWKDRIRKWIVIAPLLTLVYCLFYKGLILDGWAGVYYTLQRVYAEVLLSLMLLDKKLRRDTEAGDRRLEEERHKRHGKA